MNKKKQAAYGRIGGSKKGPTKKRDIDYAALARLRWAKARGEKK